MNKSRITKALVIGCVICCSSTFLPVLAAGKTDAVSNKPSPTLESLQAQFDKDEDEISPDLVNQLQDIIKREPNNAKAYFLLAEVYKASGYGDLAEQMYEKSDSLSPFQASTLLQLFTERLEQNDTAGASKYFNYLQKRYPRDGSVMFMRGAILAESNPYIADKVFSEAIKMSPPESPVRTSVAAFRLAWNRPQEALDLAMQDLKKNPNGFHQNLIVGKCLFALNRFPQALPYLQKVYETQPTNTNLADVYARDLLDLGKTDEALEPALVNLALQHDHLKLEKAKVHMKSLVQQVSRNQLTVALKSADSKLNKTVYQARLHLAIADVLDRCGQRELAISEYKRGLEIDPSIGRGYFRLARDLDEIGKRTEARHYYREALIRNPADPQVRNSYKRLEQRLTNERNDLALRAKDWFRQAMH